MLIFAFVAICPPAFGDFKEGVAAYVRGDYATAVREFHLLAEQGGASAKSILGLMYERGDGVPQDHAEAVRWYRRAAVQGHAAGQYHLGFSYYKGQGVPRDPERGARWQRKAAQQGYAAAQYILGEMHYLGEGMPQDFAAAVRWWRKAAEQGNASAQWQLGLMYEIGQSVPQNYVEAMRWYRKAAEQGDAAAQFSLGQLYKKCRQGWWGRRDCGTSRLYSAPEFKTRNNAAVKARERITREMAPAQVAEAQRLARLRRPKREAARQTPPAKDTALIRQQIAHVQRQLASLGYDTGPADGVLGPKTRAAIRALEAREGLPVTGTISKRLEKALRTGRPALANVTPPAPRALKKKATGSGFYVSLKGHVLTNRHVVSKCRKVRVKGARDARKISADEKLDLALLEVSPVGRGAAVFRGGRGIRTGDDIIVAGYPLQQILSSDLNVTKGTVSALAGPGDDRRIMQITAPVQPGNSGGPVLDISGHVVGVVVSKLNAIKLARATGMLSENVNFAISEGITRGFLDAHDVPYDTSMSDKPRPTADIAASAKQFTVLIECWN